MGSMLTLLMLPGIRSGAAHTSEPVYKCGDWMDVPALSVVTPLISVCVPPIVLFVAEPAYPYALLTDLCFGATPCIFIPKMERGEATGSTCFSLTSASCITNSSTSLSLACRPRPDNVQ